MKQINTWSPEEAESWFKQIEEPNKREFVSLEWKQEFKFDNTNSDGSNNTTQKSISSFANTYGGSIIIGFSNDKRVIGIENGPIDLSNIENFVLDRLRSKLNPCPQFRARVYDYKTHKIAVIFVGPSRKPIRCDNGAYYYREQSQSRPLDYNQLEIKFRESFEEEKYIYLVKKELERIIRHCEDMLRKEGQRIDYKFSPLSKTLLIAGEKLYVFLSENKILEDYSKFIDLLVVWLSNEENSLMTPTAFKTFKERADSFLKDIQRAEKNETAN
jgi:hypothetical protein